MSEKLFRGRLAANNKLISNLIWIPVENSASKSMPDQHFLNKHAVSGWVELKTLPNPNCKIEFQNGQPRWIHTYDAMGGNCFIACSFEEKGDIYLWTGDSALPLSLKKSKSVLPIKTFTGLQPELKMLNWINALER